MDTDVRMIQVSLGVLTCRPAAHEGEDVLEVRHLQQNGSHRAIHGRGDAGHRNAAEREGQPGPHRKHCTSAESLTRTIFVHCGKRSGQPLSSCGESSGQHPIQICVLGKVMLLFEVEGNLDEREGRSNQPIRTCC